LPGSPLGTAGRCAMPAHWTAFSFLRDVFIECDLARLWAGTPIAAHSRHFVVHPNDRPYDSDLVGGRWAGYPRSIEAEAQDQYLPNLVNAGVAVIERKI
jgi:hypothetical protein